MDKIFTPKNILIFVLIVSVIVLSVINFKSYQTIHTKEMIAADTQVQQETIDELSKENQNLQNDLDIEKNKNESRVVNDAKAFLNAYYNSSDNQLPIWERFEDIEPYSTNNLIQSLTPSSSVSSYSGTNTTSYYASTTIKDVAYETTTDNTASVLALIDTKLQVSSSTSENGTLLKLSMQYDSAKGRWVVNSIDYSVPVDSGMIH